jgi:ABC-type polysaccharide/polyol phosphate transport system ATPase subunit
MTTVIRLDNVSKRFILRRDRARSFQEVVTRLWRQRRPPEEFWALKNISFEIKQGDAVGLIGPNGAGKSTALKLITRIIEPTSGNIEVNGRVAALLELGAGFHPDLTGRENIFLNGSILGLSRREIKKRLDSIVEFSGIGRFVDVPIRHYSSGMQVRLGFSIATAVEPDILLIDEVLAVGDQAFQAKCLQRITEMLNQGTTLLFVSHNADTVRKICRRVIRLEQGQLLSQGDATTIVNGYLRDVSPKDEVTLDDSGTPQAGQRWGSGLVEIIDVRFLDDRGQERSEFCTGEALLARIAYRAHQRIPNPSFGVALHRSDGTHVTGPNTAVTDFLIDYIEGEGIIEYAVDHLPLLPGEYQFTVTVYDQYSVHPYDHHHRMYKFEVRPGMTRESEGVVSIPCCWRHHPLEGAEGLRQQDQSDLRPGRP